MRIFWFWKETDEDVDAMSTKGKFANDFIRDLRETKSDPNLAQYKFLCPAPILDGRLIFLGMLLMCLILDLFHLR